MASRSGASASTMESSPLRAVPAGMGRDDVALHRHAGGQADRAVALDGGVQPFISVQDEVAQVGRKVAPAPASASSTTTKTSPPVTPMPMAAYHAAWPGSRDARSAGRIWVGLTASSTMPARQQSEPNTRCPRRCHRPGGRRGLRENAQAVDCLAGAAAGDAVGAWRPASHPAEVAGGGALAHPQLQAVHDIEDGVARSQRCPGEGRDLIGAVLRAQAIRGGHEDAQ